MSIQTLFNSLRKNSAVRRGLVKSGGARLATVASYLKRMTETCGVEELSRSLNISVSAIESEIKKSRERVVWFDEKNATPTQIAYASPTGTGLEVKRFLKEEPAQDESKKEEQPATGDTEQKALTDGAVMEFDCVVTSKSRDRDGDILEPAGAIIDPKMPLLWQHSPWEPIGKFLAILNRNEEIVKIRCMIANTELGRDAAMLVKAGCLRISHGFAPIEYQPLKDDNGRDMGGWHITKYAMMEVSLVSIPSNVDAEISAWNSGKFHHPLTKSWANFLAANRKKSVSGFDLPARDQNVNITVTVLGADGAKSGAATVVKAAKEDEEEDKKEEDKEEVEDKTAKEDEKVEEEDKGKKEDDDTEDEEKGKKEGEEVVTDDEDDEDDDEEDSELEEEVESDEDGDGDSDDGDANASEDGGNVRVLGDLIDSVREMSGNQNLPKEAQRRLSVVSGMLEDIEESIGSSSDSIGQAAKSRDLATMFMAVAELVDNCVKYLARAQEELGRVCSVDGIDDTSKSTLEGLSGDAKTIVEAISALTGRIAKAEDEMDSLDDDDMDGKEGDEEEEIPEYDADEDDTDDDDEDDSELEEEEEEKANDDEEEETKEGDDEEQEEKAEEDTEEEKADEDSEAEEDEEKGRDDEDTFEDENPNSEPAGGANPGVNDKRELAKLLGKKLVGQKLSVSEAKKLKKLLSRNKKIG